MPSGALPAPPCTAMMPGRQQRMARGPVTFHQPDDSYKLCWGMGPNIPETPHLCTISILTGVGIPSKVKSCVK